MSPTLNQLVEQAATALWSSGHIDEQQEAAVAAVLRLQFEAATQAQCEDMRFIADALNRALREAQHHGGLEVAAHTVAIQLGISELVSAVRHQAIQVQREQLAQQNAETLAKAHAQRIDDIRDAEAELALANAALEAESHAHATARATRDDHLRRVEQLEQQLGAVRAELAEAVDELLSCEICETDFTALAEGGTTPGRLVVCTSCWNMSIQTNQAVRAETWRAAATIAVRVLDEYMALKPGAPSQFGPVPEHFRLGGRAAAGEIIARLEEAARALQSTGETPTQTERGA